MIINGNLNLSFCRSLTSLESLTEVNGNLNLEDCYNLENLRSLKKVRSIEICECKITTLDLIVEKGIYAYSCHYLTSLGPSIKRVNGSLVLRDCEKLSNINSIEYVQNTLNLIGTKVSTLPEKLEVDGAIYLYDSFVTEEWVRKNRPKLLSKCDWIK